MTQKKTASDEEVKRLKEYIDRYRQDMLEDWDPANGDTEEDKPKPCPEPLTVESCLRYFRDEGWDLWSALHMLQGELDNLEKDDITHGSCQNIYSRLAAQLAFHYLNDLEPLYDWST